MSHKEPSFIRQVAIGTWYCLSSDTKAAWEARESEEARRIESFRREMQKIVGDKLDFNITINGGCLEAVIEDLHFVAYEFASPRTGEHQTAVTLLGRCSSCGTETMSRPFRDLSGLGERLVTFVPIFCHYCA